MKRPGLMDRHTRRFARSAAVAPVILIAAVIAASCVDGRVPQAHASSAAVATPSVASPDVVNKCRSLIQMAWPNALITSARVIPASDSLPEYCKAEGGIEKVILFEVAMPTTAWNGKFFYAGGGGYNGTIPDLTHALARGYAAAGTDTGHRGDHWDASPLYNDPQAQVNYAHRGAHVVTMLAKEIARAYYGRAARRSYFMGCSNGGKMGLMAVQRYPDDFDGVVVGGAVVDRTGLMLAFNWTQQALLPEPIPPYRIPAMSKATLDACDARDGLADGIIDRPDACKFDPKTVQCASGVDNASCLTPGQVKAWEKILAGPTNSAGQQLFPGFSPGHEDDYPSYMTGLGTLHGYPSSNWMYMDNFMRWFVFGPAFDSVRQFDFDKSPVKLAPFVKEQNAENPDLSAFKARSGKLIIWNGWADHSTPPLRTIEYYNEVRKKTGAETDEFARLFLVPGFHHCSGGPGPNYFGSGRFIVDKDDPERDILAALDRWVEEGVAPKQIVATKYVNDDPKRGVARTRPLCAYPQVAKYKGVGSIDDAANFACALP